MIYPKRSSSRSLSLDNRSGTNKATFHQQQHAQSSVPLQTSWIRNVSARWWCWWLQQRPASDGYRTSLSIALKHPIHIDQRVRVRLYIALGAVFPYVSKRQQDSSPWLIHRKDISSYNWNTRTFSVLSFILFLGWCKVNTSTVIFMNANVLNERLHQRSEAAHFSNTTSTDTEKNGKRGAVAGQINKCISIPGKLTHTQPSDRGLQNPYHTQTYTHAMIMNGQKHRGTYIA